MGNPEVWSAAEAARDMALELGLSPSSSFPISVMKQGGRGRLVTRAWECGSVPCCRGLF